MQKIILIGNLGADPETKASGEKEFYTAKIAVSTYNSKTKENDTTWYSLVFGEFMANRVKVMSKGMKLYIEGKLTVKTYEKDDETRLDHSVYVSEVQILSKIEKKEGDDEGEEKPKGKKVATKKDDKKKKSSPLDDDNEEGEAEDDGLPF